MEGATSLTFVQLPYAQLAAIIYMARLHCKPSSARRFVAMEQPGTVFTGRRSDPNLSFNTALILNPGTDCGH
jgi:hypothetical protein